MQFIVEALRDYFQLLEAREFYKLKLDYEALLFRKDKPSTFRNKQGETFPGFIKGVDASGNLQVLLENDILKVFELKEVQLLY